MLNAQVGRHGRSRAVWTASESEAVQTPKGQHKMVMISILYPNRNGSKFDLAYYINTHMPMSIERLRTHAGFKGVSVVRSLESGVPGPEPAYVAMCHYLFDSFEGFLAAFNPHAAFLQGDKMNYTNIEPIIQISAVEIKRAG